MPFEIIVFFVLCILTCQTLYNNKTFLLPAILSVLLGATTLSAQETLECGKPALGNVDFRGVYVWQDCETSNWVITGIHKAAIDENGKRITHDENGQRIAFNYSGLFFHDGIVSTIEKNRFEPKDVAKINEDNSVEFAIRVRNGFDEFQYHLPQGASYLCLMMNNRQDEVYYGKNQLQSNQPINLLTGETLAGCDADGITLSQVNVTGNVAFDSDEPIEGAAISLWQDNAVIATTQTDSSGQFEFALAQITQGKPYSVKIVYQTEDQPIVTQELHGNINAGNNALGTIYLVNPYGAELALQPDGTATAFDSSLTLSNFPETVTRAWGKPYNPAMDMSVFPGDLGESTGDILNSSGFVWLYAQDENGTSITEFESPVNVKFEVARSQWADLWDVTPQNGVLDIPIYSYNEDLSTWVAEPGAQGVLLDAEDNVITEAQGRLIRNGDFTGPVFAQFEASHFSFWNIDYATKKPGCPKQCPDGYVYDPEKGTCVLPPPACVPGGIIVPETGECLCIVNGLPPVNGVCEGAADVLLPNILGDRGDLNNTTQVLHSTLLGTQSDASIHACRTVWLGEWVDGETAYSNVLSNRQEDNYDDGIEQCPVNGSDLIVRINNLMADKKDHVIYVNMVMDMNGDGDWDDAGEWVVQNAAKRIKYRRGDAINLGALNWNTEKARITATPHPIDNFTGQGIYIDGESEDYDGCTVHTSVVIKNGYSPENQVTAVNRDSQADLGLLCQQGNDASCTDTLLSGYVTFVASDSNVEWQPGYQTMHRRGWKVDTTKTNCLEGSTGKSCTVKADRDLVINAKFKEDSRVALIQGSVSGNGTISTSDNRLQCAADSSCSAYVAAASMPIQLTAQANAGASFTRWTAGPCNGSSNPVCTINANMVNFRYNRARVNVAASFTNTVTTPEYNLEFQIGTGVLAFINPVGSTHQPIVKKDCAGERPNGLNVRYCGSLETDKVVEVRLLTAPSNLSISGCEVSDRICRVTTKNGLSLIKILKK